MTLHPDLVLRFLARPAPLSPLQQPGTAELAHHSAAALFCSDSEFLGLVTYSALTLASAGWRRSEAPKDCGESSQQ